MLHFFLRPVERVRLVVGPGSVVAIHSHWSVTLVVVGAGAVGAVNRDLGIVGAQSVAMSVRVGEQTSLEHFILAGLDAWHGVGGGEGALLDLCEVVLRVAVEGHASELNERVVALGPDLSDVKDIPFILGSVGSWHHLDTHAP